MPNDGGIMINILILNSKKTEVEHIQRLIRDVTRACSIYVADNAMEAYGYAMNMNIGLFIVDAVLNYKKVTDVAGMDFVRNIRQIPSYKLVPVIFLSTLEDAEMYAYRELHCYKFFMRPVYPQELQAAIRDVIDNQTGGARGVLTLRNQHKIYVFDKDEIAFIKSSRDKVTIMTRTDRTELYFYTCSELLRLLDSRNFAKCNRNTIVNVRYIYLVDPVDEWIVLKHDLGKLKLGPVIKKDFLMLLN